MKFAIHAERHRGVTTVESQLMIKHPDVWRSRGFMSSYTSPKQRRGHKRADPKAIKLIADFLHVSFEWLFLGSGPMRRAGRGATPAEEALFIARDWGVRGDAWELAWELNKEREDSMSAEEWFDAIRSAATKLEREGVPRPEVAVAAMDGRTKVRRASGRVARVKTKAQTRIDAPVPAESEQRAASGDSK